MNRSRQLALSPTDQYQFRLQVYADRSHITYYNPISTHQSPDGKGSSTLVLTLSNWHFNERAQKLEKDVTCLLKDCKVSIKLASESFQGLAQRRRKQTTSKRNDEYKFDKTGLCIDYCAFLALISQFLPEQEEFWRTIETKYKVSARVALTEREAVVPSTSAATSRDEKRSHPTGGKGKSPAKSKRGRYQKLHNIVRVEEEDNDDDDGIPDDNDDDGDDDEDNDDYSGADEDGGFSQIQDPLLLMPAPPPPPPLTPPPPPLPAHPSTSRAGKSGSRRK